MEEFKYFVVDRFMFAAGSIDVYSLGSPRTMSECEDERSYYEERGEQDLLIVHMDMLPKVERCLNCGRPISEDRLKEWDSFCSDKCRKEFDVWCDEQQQKEQDEMEELFGKDTRGLPVSYCCICDGMGGPDGKRCWGCQ